jgi:HSP20 family molecular chaperone IbpA
MQTIGDKLKIVAELPGITTQDLDLEVYDNTLHIITRGNARHACTSVDLPPIDVNTLTHTLYRGVLEITINKKLK